jgi:hypothetical protein
MFLNQFLFVDDNVSDQANHENESHLGPIL